MKMASAGWPFRSFNHWRDALERYNVHAEDVNRVVETGLAGKAIGAMMDGNRRFPIVVRLAEELRMSQETMKRLPLRTDDGGLLTLGQVASIKLVEQVGRIARENTQRRVAILVNVRGRDTAGFVQEATAKLRERVNFAEGYYFEFGGQFRNLVEARQRLIIIGGIVSSTFLTLLVLPVLYEWMERKRPALVVAENENIRTEPTT